MNSLARKHTFWSLLRFTAPTMIMMVFMSMYTMVDGMFVSHYVGTAALSAVNIAYPAISVVVAIGIMLATGGSAVIAAQMGQGEGRLAKENFSMLIWVGIGIGLLLSALGFFFLRPLVSLLGANAATFDYCLLYLQVMLPFIPLAILQMLFQYFFVTAGKPILGLAMTVAGGLANIVLDYLFIVPMGMGVAGAALATGIGYAIPGLFGICYFALRRSGTLCLVRPRWRPGTLLSSCFNGSSEMVTNLATAITTYLFNIIMMRLLGEDGVAAITIVLYAQFLLTAIYLGYASGVGPVISFNHGSGNYQQLGKVFRISLLFIGLCSLLTFGASLALCRPLVALFTANNQAVFDLAVRGFVLYGISYLFIGVNIFASALFTAFGDGRVSAIISFLRTFLFLVAAILLLPMAMGIDGVWLSAPVAEVAALLVSLWYLVRLRHKYGYA